MIGQLGLLGGGWSCRGVEASHHSSADLHREERRAKGERVVSWREERSARSAAASAAGCG